VQPEAEVVRRGHAEGDSGCGDLALGAKDALVDRRLAGEERARDLRHRQPADRPQRQRDLALARDGRVAAREQQREPVLSRLPPGQADSTALLPPG
jgi:hypothetical protein